MIHLKTLIYSTLPVGSIFYLTFLYFCLSYQQQQRHRSKIQANNTSSGKTYYKPKSHWQETDEQTFVRQHLLFFILTSNHFQMSEQRKHNLLSNLKPLTTGQMRI